jgi:hypothetical protein
MKRPKAVALLSGGLDSTLAVLIMLREGVDVTAVTFLTQFGCDITDSSSCSRDPLPAAKKYGFQLKLCHLADKFLEIVKNPKYGHGKNMNPCIDCRILMLREAKTLMELIGADFVVTGEVLGQRPMSQRRECFPLIDREAGLEGLVLRPLSAKLLPPTIPEKQGLVNRQHLYGIRGRSRKVQMALAEEFGLDDYPSPAGGCLLTDPIYSWRLRDLLDQNSDPSIKEIQLLRVGRHFRLSATCKAIVGRNKMENEQILAMAEEGDTLLRVPDVGSPVTLLSGQCDENAILLAASITARYSDARDQREVSVLVYKKSADLYSLVVNPIDNETLEPLRIAPPEPKRKKRQRAVLI